MDKKEQKTPLEIADDSEQLKEKRVESMVRSSLDPKHLPHSLEKEEEKYKEEMKQHGCPLAHLPPGSMGLPFLGDNAKIIFKDGFEYFRKRSEEYGKELGTAFAPLFTTHMFGQPAIAIAGAEEAKLFYDPSLVERCSAFPPQLLKYFFGDDTMITKDGPSHEARKKNSNEGL